MPITNSAPTSLPNICKGTKPAPIRVPFSANTPEPVPVQYGQYIYFVAPDAPGTVHIVCDKPTIFSPQLDTLDVSAHNWSPGYCPVAANDHCVVTTSYDFGGGPQSVGRTIHISQEGPGWRIPFQHAFSAIPGGCSALIIVVLVGAILWLLVKRKKN
jgi:hypothetical protein